MTTSVNGHVTDSERNGDVGRSTRVGARREDRARVRPGARLRDGAGADPPDPVPVPLPPSPHAVTLRARVWAWVMGLLRRLHDCSPYADRPESIRDVVEYTRAGGWVPGDHSWRWELPGYVYGYLVAIPVTVVLHAIGWVARRPSRVLGVLLVYGVLWLVWS